MKIAFLVMAKFFRQTRKSLLKKNRLFKYLSYALGEIILVMIGILLALKVNTMNEKQKTDQNVKTTLRLLKDEIIINKNHIAQVKDYHVMVRDSIVTVKTPEKAEDIKNSFPFWRGMGTPRMQSAAFQTAIQSGVSKEFDPLLLKSLNNLYTYQESYNGFTANSSQIFYTTDLSDINNFGKIVTAIHFTMSDLYYYDEGLMRLFENSLTKMDSLYPDIKIKE